MRVSRLCQVALATVKCRSYYIRYGNLDGCLVTRKLVIAEFTYNMGNSTETARTAANAYGYPTHAYGYPKRQAEQHG